MIEEFLRTCGTLYCWWFDEAGAVLECNPAVESRMGGARGARIGDSVLLLPDPTEWERAKVECDVNGLSEWIRLDLKAAEPTASLRCRLVAVPSGRVLLGEEIDSSKRRIQARVDKLTAELAAVRREREATERLLRQLAHTDELTGVLNRRGFFLRAEAELSRAGERGYGSLLFFADLDNFKAVNDRYGHKVGDQVLVDVARALCSAVRGLDLVGRFGGDEFVILALDAGEEHEVLLRSRIDYHLSRVRNGIDSTAVTVSLGVVSVPSSRPTALQDLLSEVDARMYEEKRVRRDGRDEMRTAPRRL